MMLEAKYILGDQQDNVGNQYNMVIPGTFFVTNTENNILLLGLEVNKGTIWFSLS